MELLSRFRNLWRPEPNGHDHRILQARDRVRPFAAVDYAYEALPDGDCIRIFALEPGRFDDDVVIHLKTWPFSEGTSLEYEAISYTWGSDADKTFVYAGYSLTTITVPQNLDVVLRYLRHETKPRHLWADSICINQKNDVEKGPQVAMMSRIFGVATRVLFWLGPEDATSSLAMDLMRNIGSQTVVNWPVVDPTLPRLAIRPAPSARDPDWGDEGKDISLTKYEAIAISELTSRAWFKRLWIRQEIFCASDQSIIICGDSQIPWTTFRYALTVLWRKSFAPGTPASVVERFGQFESDILGLCYHQKHSLSQLRARYGTAECKDPRDRIYAVLSQIIPDTLARQIRPNYTISMAEVYEDAAFRYLNIVGDRNILEACRWHPDSELPSWVPDWSRNETFQKSLGFQQASSGLITALYSSEPKRLTLDGVVITKPTKLFSFTLNADSALYDFLEQIGEFLDHLRDCLRMESIQQGTQPALKHFAQALAINMNAERCEPRADSRPTLADSIEHFSRLLACKDATGRLGVCDDKGLERFVSQARDLLVGRKLFTTPDGHVGVVPDYTREDDLVCVILGHAVPFVLRPVSDEDHILIGQCFVPGFDHGEAILGPLPDDVEPVFFTNVNKWLFRNKDTCAVSYEDPRYCRLSIDLEPFRDSWRNNRKVWLVVEAATLRATGVQVQKFTLV
ncbi:heterokaryon incompatibility protein-domain-containing protein [Xylariales sp. AK1849]|nr:heterokaryon incompatibility protein-domain-containing protein [Xylariales sp. AK1849]